MTLNKATCDFASVPLSQKKSQLSQSVDQNPGNSEFEFNNLH